MSDNKTQAAIFAAEHAKDAAREMLDGIKHNASAAEKVTKIGLGVSMPHQIAFILSLVPLHFPVAGSAQSIIIGWLESLTLIGGAIGIPVGVDYLILICIRALGARAVARNSKLLAFAILFFPVLVSGTVNVLAPAPTLVKALFGVAVVLIPMSQAVRVWGMTPDFRKVEAMELDIRAQVTTTTEDASTVGAAGVTRVTSSASAARRRAANARVLFGENPNLTVSQLAAAAGIGRNTAKRIIDSATLVADVEDALEGATK